MNEARQPLFVPVRRVPGGVVSPQIARLPEGARAGLAFTSERMLSEACRPDQPWIRLSAAALRALLSPLGITRIQLDPLLIMADPSRPALERNVPSPVGPLASVPRRG